MRTTLLYTFLAAIFLAASCRKDNGNIEIQEDDPGYDVIPYSISVGISPMTDTIDGVELKTTFAAGDVIQISSPRLLAEPAILTSDDCIGKHYASFSGNLKVKLGASLTSGSTKLTAALRNTVSDSLYNGGMPFMDIKEISSFEEGVEKYSYWACENYTCSSSEDFISIAQKTAFVEFEMPFSGADIYVTKAGAYCRKTLATKHEIIAVPEGMNIKTKLWNVEKNLELKDGFFFKITIEPRKLVPKNCISGFFSIGKDSKCYFSKGNLQYSIDEKIWRFAPSQYDRCFSSGDTVVGANHKPLFDTGRWIDYFAMGTWLKGQTETAPLLTATPDEFYEVVFDDNNNLVGDAVIGSQWTLLTGGDDSEWDYLLNKRPDASSKYGIATVADVQGLILLPDIWVMPEGIKNFQSGLASESGSMYFGNINSYNAEEWEKMEAAGAVFLPACGYRGGNSIYYIDNNGGYRALNVNPDSGKVYHLSFYSDKISPKSKDVISHGRSVRFVLKVK